MGTFSNTTEMSRFSPVGEKTPISDYLENGFPLTDAIDWFWRNFVSDDNLGLRDALIRPLVGDYDRIRENGNAWRHISEQFQFLSQNLTDNTATLHREYWTKGAGADAFRSQIETYWVGGLWMAEEVSNLIAEGFDKTAEWCIALAERASKLLDTIIKRIMKLSAKAVPGSGWVVGAVEWAASGFEEFPYWSDVQDILAMVTEVRNLHAAIQNVVDAISGYMGVTGQILSAVQRIPDINSTQDVIAIGTSIHEGTKQMKESKADYKQLKGELDDQLGRVEGTLPL